MGMNALTEGKLKDLFCIYVICLVFVFNPVDMCFYFLGETRNNFPAVAGK